MSEESALVISYIPLFYCTPDTTIDDALEHMKAIEDLHIEGCVWFTHDDRLGAAFLVKNANDIYDHLMWWCENNPRDAFSVTVGVNDVAYGILFHADMRWSVGRCNSNRLKLGLEPFGDGLQINLISQQLSFYSPLHGSYDQQMVSKAEVDRFINIAFIEYASFKGVQHVVDSDLLHVGELRVDDCNKYFKDWLDEATSVKCDRPNQMYSSN